MTLLAPSEPSLVAGYDVEFGGLVEFVQAGPGDPAPGDPGDVRPSPPMWVDQAVVLQEAVTHRRVAELETAFLTSWSDPHMLDTPAKHAVTVSAFDPVWDRIPGGRQFIDDRLVLAIDPDAWEIAYVENGVTLAVGLIDGEMPINDDTVTLDLSGAAAVLDTTMGSGVGFTPGQVVGTPDALNGSGTFDAKATPEAAGWGLEPANEDPDLLQWQWNYADPLTGDRSLQVKGFGQVHGPWVTVHSSPHYRQPVGTTPIVRVPLGQVQVTTDLFRTGSLAPVAVGSSYQGAGASDEGKTSWQAVPSTSRLEQSNDTVWMRSTIQLFGTGTEWVDIGLVAYPIDGYVGTVTTDEIAQILERVITQVQRAGSADSQNLGVTVLPHTPVGIFDSYHWAESDDTSIREALGTVMAVPGGPEMWNPPGSWAFQAGPRRGRRRPDAALTPDNVISAEFHPDTKSRVDQLKVVTEYGSGASRVAFDFRNGRRNRPRRQVVPAPTGQSYEQARAWGAGQHAVASSEAWTATVVVADWVGRLLATGDEVWAAIVLGAHARWGWVRISNRTFDTVARTCSLEIAAVPD